MIRMFAVLTALALVAGCAVHRPPASPDRPDCAIAPDKAPIDGGIGGTGKGEDPPCRTPDE